MSTASLRINSATPVSPYLRTAANVAKRANNEDRGLTDAERADITRLMRKAKGDAR